MYVVVMYVFGMHWRPRKAARHFCWEGGALGPSQRTSNVTIWTSNVTLWMSNDIISNVAIWTSEVTIWVPHVIIWMPNVTV